MSATDALKITDWRSKIPRKDWSIGIRSKTDAITIHYNGPEVATSNQSGSGLLNQMIADAQWQMRPGGLGSADGGDGIQYHYVIANDGLIYQLRDATAKLWHCGDSDGNAHSLSLHLPLGGSQNTTAVQWSATLNLIKALMTDWNVKNARVLGHLEWPQSSTICPGPIILPKLKAWRNDQESQGGVTHIIKDVAAANIREGPGTTFPVALGGKAVMFPGDTLVYDAIIKGQTIGGDNRWLHLSSSIGFVHVSLVDSL